jgi:hypothetical protein
MTVRTTAVAARRAPGIVAGAALSAALLAAVARPAAAAPADAAAALVDRESDLLRQYRELERSFLRLADLLAASDPRRAALLRSVFEKAREEQVGDRLGTIVTLLEQGQLLKAGTTQAGTIEQFRALLDLLESGDGERRLVNTKKEVREYLARLAKAIARQRDIEGSTEAGGREADLSERQRALAEETRALADEIGGFAGRLDARDGSGGFKPPPEDDGRAGDDPKQPGDQPGTAPAGEPGAEPAGKTPAPTEAPGGGATEAGEEEGKPAGDDDAARARRTQRRLAAAQRRMQSARERLDDARRQDARQEQQKALEELETASRRSSARCGSRRWSSCSCSSRPGFATCSRRSGGCRWVWMPWPPPARRAASGNWRPPGSAASSSRSPTRPRGRSCSSATTARRWRSRRRSRPSVTTRPRWRPVSAAGTSAARPAASWPTS